MTHINLRALLPIGVAIYRRSSAGCCLHIVMDDRNLRDGDVDFCIEEATRNSHADCTAVAVVMRVMSKTQRRRFTAMVHAQEDEVRCTPPRKTDTVSHGKHRSR